MAGEEQEKQEREWRVRSTRIASPKTEHKTYSALFIRTDQLNSQPEHVTITFEEITPTPYLQRPLSPPPRIRRMVLYSLLPIVAIAAHASRSMVDPTTIFSAGSDITQYADEVAFVMATDMDDDGDLDVLYSTGGFSEVSWFRNTDGLGNFSSEITIPGVWTDGPVYFADMDGDGGMDIVIVTGDGACWFPRTGDSYGTESCVFQGS